MLVLRAFYAGALVTLTLLIWWPHPKRRGDLASVTAWLIGLWLLIEVLAFLGQHVRWEA